MNTVSFGSTYRLKNMKDYSEKSSVIDFCENNDLEYAAKTESISAKNGFYFSSPKIKMSTSIIAPDDKDKLVEAFLANKGIDFKKLNTEELLDKRKMESRIEKAPKDMRLVRVDAKKLEELESNQDSNFSYCEGVYNEFFKDGINLMIKSGDDIPATSLYIIPRGESTDDVVDYVKKFGEDRLNDDQISFIFNQQTEDNDHCMYFGMKDLGMDKIPVYVNDDTYKIGKALKIFE